MEAARGDGLERRAAAPCHWDVNKGFRSLLSALVWSSSTFDSFWSTCGHLLSPVSFITYATVAVSVSAYASV